MKLPFLPDKRSADPLLRIVEQTAARTGLPAGQVATLASHFFEEVAHQVSLGRAVRIPGFGAFFPVVTMALIPRSQEMVATNVVRFSAARGFREEVRHGAPRNDAGRRGYVRHMRNHALGGPKARCSQRAFMAQRAFRQSIAAQLGGEVSFD